GLQVNVAYSRSATAPSGDISVEGVTFEVEAMMMMMMNKNIQRLVMKTNEIARVEYEILGELKKITHALGGSSHMPGHDRPTHPDSDCRELVVADKVGTDDP